MEPQIETGWLKESFPKGSFQKLVGAGVFTTPDTTLQQVMRAVLDPTLRRLSRLRAYPGLLLEHGATPAPFPERLNPIPIAGDAVGEDGGPESHFVQHRSCER